MVVEGRIETTTFQFRLLVGLDLTDEHRLLDQRVNIEIFLHF
jgi:hypothetical protein